MCFNAGFTPLMCLLKGMYDNTMYMFTMFVYID